MRPDVEPPKFGFEPLDHVALIEKNGWAELSRITQVSGSRTYCLKGRLALLETKLMAWALETIAGAGFTPITVPALAREQAFLNQGQFPGHKEETYAIGEDDLWLAGTAEVALTSLHSGEILDADKLPILSPVTRLVGARRASPARTCAGCCASSVRQGGNMVCEADYSVSAEWHSKLLGWRKPARRARDTYQVVRRQPAPGLGK